jgi:RNA polymerase sigma factor (sigma-70 family)
VGVLVDVPAGDEQAFERLYRGYARNVYRYALAVLGQTADAEDVTQTTFLNAYRAYLQGERPRAPERWLIAIAHNACRQRFRTAQHRPREVELDERLGVTDGDAHETPTADELRRALMEIPENQRAALVMREFEGRSCADVAATLSISESALETLLFRARRSLREQLEGSLSCREAATAMAQLADGPLPEGETRVLRAHLRTCADCARIARSARARHGVLRGHFWFLPSLRLWRHMSRTAGTPATGGLGTAGVALKAAALVAVGASVGTSVYAGARHVFRPSVPAPSTPASIVPSHDAPRVSVSPTTPRGAGEARFFTPVVPSAFTSDASAPATATAPVSVPSTGAAVLATSQPTGASASQSPSSPGVAAAPPAAAGTGSAQSAAVSHGVNGKAHAAQAPGQAKKAAAAAPSTSATTAAETTAVATDTTTPTTTSPTTDTTSPGNANANGQSKPNGTAQAPGQVSPNPNAGANAHGDGNG